jgi:hypothetical protein
MPKRGANVKGFLIQARRGWVPVFVESEDRAEAIRVWKRWIAGQRAQALGQGFLPAIDVDPEEPTVVREFELGAWIRPVLVRESHEREVAMSATATDVADDDTPL